MAHVAEVIDGIAADIHADSARHDRAQLFFLAAERIVDADHEAVLMQIERAVRAPWPAAWLSTTGQAQGHGTAR